MLEVVPIPAFRFRGVILLLALLAPGILVSSAAEDDHPAVAIHKPSLQIPLEASGTGVVPEAKITVTVDARGRVTDVKVLGISPSSEYDEIFREEVRETLLRWRYAPAISDGKPTETILQWIEQFPARGEVLEADAPGGPIWRIGSRRGDRDATRARILSLPDAQRAAMLENLSKAAERHIDTRHRRSVESPGVVVVSDAPDEDAARIVAQNLSYTAGLLGELLGENLESQPAGYKLVAYVFARESSFAAFKRDAGAHDWASGTYHPAGLLAIHLEMPTNESLMSILLHEATHAYMDRYVIKPGVLLPLWMEGGFAEYIGNSQVKKGKLVPGKVPKRQIYQVAGWGAFSGVSEQRATVKEMKDEVRAAKAPGADQIVAASRGEFYGEDRRYFYPMSWLLVHFLRHGEESWKDVEFPRLLLYLAEGYPAPETLRTVYGLEPDELNRKFRAYVKAF